MFVYVLVYLILYLKLLFIESIQKILFYDGNDFYYNTSNGYIYLVKSSNDVYTLSFSNTAPISIVFVGIFTLYEDKFQRWFHFMGAILSANINNYMDFHNI